MLTIVLGGCATVSPYPSAKNASTHVLQPLAAMQVPATPAAQTMTELLQGDFALRQDRLKEAAAAYAQAMRSSSDPRVAAQTVALAIGIGRATLAQAALARWQVLGASQAELADARARLALQQGQKMAAVRALRDLRGPGSDGDWAAVFRVLVLARDRALAGVVLEALATPMQLPGDRSQIWVATSQLAERLGRYDFARHLANTEIAHFGDARGYLWRAMLARRDGSAGQADRLLRKGLVYHPKNISLRLAYAGELAKRGDFSAALRWLAQGPQNTRTFRLRAAYAVKLDDHLKLAVIYAELARAPAAIRTQSLFLLGQLAEVLKRPAAALRWYVQVPRSSPQAFLAGTRRAVLLNQDGHYQKAMQLAIELTREQTKNPDNFRRGLVLQAELAMRAHDYAAAIIVYRRALLLKPGDIKLLYAQGVAEAEVGNVDAAVRDLRRLLRLKPDDMEAVNALGYTLADAGRDLPEAEKLLSRALAARPGSAAVNDSWGWLQYRLGHLQTAELALRKAWKLSRNADIGAHLAIVLWKRGAVSEARKILQQARQIDPHNRAVNKALARIGT
ncbi:MAG TPA: tetratricopeptide repeat protein [Mizugakiibacter sp.]|nr:tetratricopeptide repeat protein [Mizugakiibacter sp.]